MKSQFQHIEMNTVGRDFVIGDLHGCLSELQKLMNEVNFDKNRDRLFSVGDIIDRGPDSLGCMTLLEAPWFHAVRGNHEQDLIDYWANPSPEMLQYLRQDGGQWWADDLRRQFGSYNYENFMRGLVKQLASLPYALEIATKDGLVGLVHADPPQGYSWSDIRNTLMHEHCPPHVKSWLTTSRVFQTATVSMANDYGHEIAAEFVSVKGLCRLYSGHSTLEQGVPQKIGNRIWLDTGAGKGGRLTMEGITCH